MMREKQLPWSIFIGVSLTFVDNSLTFVDRFFSDIDHFIFSDILFSFLGIWNFIFCFTLLLPF